MGCCRLFLQKPNCDFLTICQHLSPRQPRRRGRRRGWQGGSWQRAARVKTAKLSATPHFLSGENVSARGECPGGGRQVSPSRPHRDAERKPKPPFSSLFIKKLFTHLAMFWRLHIAIFCIFQKAMITCLCGNVYLKLWRAYEGSRLAGRRRRRQCQMFSQS